MQLKPPLCSFWVAMCCAWKLRSRSDHGPGTTMVGLTLPSSLVIRLVLSCCAGRLARRALGTRAEHDGVVGPAAAGDVDLVDRLMTW